MNSINLVGRITRDPELRYTQSDKAITRFTLAVPRGKKKDSDEEITDFISCMAWGKTAEVVAKYCTKGRKLAVSGRLETGSYEKEDGTRVYTTDVSVQHVEFIGSNKNESQSENKPQEETPKNDDPFSDFGDEVVISDDDLPF